MTYRWIPRLASLRAYLMIALAALAPFHAFFITWVRSAAGSENVADAPFGRAYVLASPQLGLAVQILAAWREIIVVIICLTVALEFLRDKKFPKFDLLDALIIGYTLLALLFFPLHTGLAEAKQWLYGFRFDVLPFVFFLFLRHADAALGARRGLLVRVALISSAVVLIFGIAQAVFLPHDFLMNFGYSNYLGGYRPDVAISACQQLEHTDLVCRAVSVFAGPTRYGTYLLLIAGLLLPYMIKKSSHRLLTIGMFTLTFANVLLTFSRSIWIGAFVTLVVLFMWLVRRRMKITIALAGVAVFFLGGLFLSLNVEDSAHRNISLFKSLFIRDISTNEHIAYLKEGLNLAAAHPLGMGLGTVGPASVHFTKLLTENWYLQIALEMGVLGLVLFCAILVVISKKLLKKKNWVSRGLFLSLLGISVAGLFTHSFEETTTVLLLMMFFSMSLKLPAQ